MRGATVGIGLVGGSFLKEIPPTSVLNALHQHHQLHYIEMTREQ